MSSSLPQNFLKKWAAWPANFPLQNALKLNLAETNQQLKTPEAN